MRRHPGPPPSQRALRGGRKRTRAQALVEFALCAPIVFGILFGVINGGLFMYAKNAVGRAANVGAVNEAAEGVADRADLDTVDLMRKSGVSANSLASVQWVKIENVSYSATLGYQPVNTCKDSYGNPNQPCVNTYDINHNPTWGYPASCNAANYFCPAWPPSTRSIRAANASLIRLTVHYTFTFLGVGTSFTLDEVNIFRLEPKDL